MQNTDATQLPFSLSHFIRTQTPLMGEQCIVITSSEKGTLVHVE
jgi:hypothetical protein